MTPRPFPRLERILRALRLLRKVLKSPKSTSGRIELARSVLWMQLARSYKEFVAGAWENRSGVIDLESRLGLLHRCTLEAFEILENYLFDIEEADLRKELLRCGDRNAKRVYRDLLRRPESNFEQICAGLLEDGSSKPAPDEIETSRRMRAIEDVVLDSVKETLAEMEKFECYSELKTYLFSPQAGKTPPKSFRRFQGRYMRTLLSLQSRYEIDKSKNRHFVVARNLYHRFKNAWIQAKDLLTEITRRFQEENEVDNEEEGQEEGEKDERVE